MGQDWSEGFRWSQATNNCTYCSEYAIRYLLNIVLKSKQLSNYEPLLGLDMALISHIRSWTLRCICGFAVFQLLFLLTPWLSNNTSDKHVSLENAITKWNIHNGKPPLLTSLHYESKLYDQNSYQKVWKPQTSSIKPNRSSSVQNVSRSTVHFKKYKIDIIHFDFVRIHNKIELSHKYSVKFVLLCSCKNTVNTIAKSIYNSMEDIIECIRAVSISYPTALLGWINPTLYGSDNTIISKETDLIEYNQHLDYLVDKYIQEALGMLVIKPKSTWISTLRNNNNKLDSQCGGYTEDQCSYMIETVQIIVESMLFTTTQPLTDLIRYQQQSLAAYTPNTILQTCHVYLYTRKYDARCHPPQALTHAVLVTGLGGAGTHYAAQRLSAEGWDLRHEEMASDGAVVSFIDTCYVVFVSYFVCIYLLY